MTLRNCLLDAKIVMLLLLACGASCYGQGRQYEWIATAPVDDYNTDANWDGDGLNFVPNINEASGERARISNGNTAQLSSPAPGPIAELDMENGTLLIDGNGALEITVSDGSTGALIIDTAGGVEVGGAGSLNVGTSIVSKGFLGVSGPNASIATVGDFYMSGASLGANITGDNHSTISVGGVADLSGSLVVSGAGFTPSIGKNWDLVTAAGGIQSMFSDVQVTGGPALERGLQYRTVLSGNTASLEVGNTLVVQIDQQTGAASVENIVGGALSITGYSLVSNNGLLAPGGWQSLNDSGVAGGGWVTGAPSVNSISELNPDSTFSLASSQSVSLGNVLSAGSNAANQDLTFEFTTADGRRLDGVVEYVGVPNEFVLYVDPSDGSVAMLNYSPSAEAVDLTGYAILSESNQLVPGNWNSLQTSGEAGSDWLASAGLSGRLAEINGDNSFVFGFGAIANLGQVFTPGGDQDLEFLYTVAGEQEQRVGTILYEAIPDAPSGLPGDYNGDNKVDAADYTVWRDALGTTQVLPNDQTPGEVTAADYNVWRSNYGAAAGAAAAAGVTAAPEPSAVAAVAGLAIVAVGRRNKRRYETAAATR